MRLHQTPGGLIGWAVDLLDKLPGRSRAGVCQPCSSDLAKLIDSPRPQPAKSASEELTISGKGRASNDIEASCVAFLHNVKTIEVQVRKTVANRNSETNLKSTVTTCGGLEMGHCRLQRCGATTIKNHAIYLVKSHIRNYELVLVSRARHKLILVSN